MRFSIEQRILQQVIDYLVKKPYSEVAGLVAEIQKDTKVIAEIKPNSQGENERSS
jgi:hypothetical protein